MSNTRVLRGARNRQAAAASEEISTLQRTMNALRGEPLVPKGLYRFRRHQDADEWMTKSIAATHARRSSQTSSGSAAR